MKNKKIKKSDMEKVHKLNDVIDDYLNSGKGMSEFIKEHLFNEYRITGNKDLEEMAEEYFIEKLG